MGNQSSSARRWSALPGARRAVRAVFACAVVCAWALATATSALAGWKAGAARVAITPDGPLWMAGYASRTRPSEGKIHDLWAKALALEGPNGRRAVLITLDLCGISGDLSGRVRDAIQQHHHLKRDGVVLVSSHTHSGPVVGTNLITMYRIDDAEKARIAAYAQKLETQLVGVADAAFQHLEDARISRGLGRCDFAVNRRENREPDVPKLRGELALKGPVDHDVPVLRVDRPDGKPLAIVFGYACHNTTLALQKFCGDYAGFAQLAIEKRRPGAVALFAQGCGGDQNPLPRRTVELAEAYGNQLAASVDKALSGPLRAIDGPLETAYEEIPLAFAALPDRAQLEKDAQSKNFYVASRARALLKKIDAHGHLDATYPYPVAAWRLGELTWVFLGGEVVVDYSLRIKRNLGGSHTWVTGYSNDVMAYIPSLRVLKEGGYEGGGAMLYYAHPGPWSEAVEESIIQAVARVTKALDERHEGGIKTSAAPARD